MTEILRADDGAVEKCVAALLKKELILYPTDTLYGIGADATSELAVEKVFLAKRRNPDKPVSVAVESFQSAQKLAIFTPLASKIASKFLPGPLTIILKSKSHIKILSKEGKIGIRVPENDFTLKLLKKFGRPIVATSANISGGADPKEISEVLEEIIERTSIVVDQGRTKYAAPSTILDLSENTLDVIREGALSLDKIKTAIK